MKAILLSLFIGGITVSGADPKNDNTVRVRTVSESGRGTASKAVHNRGGQPRPKLLYKPPRLRAPKVSTGPGTRGDGSELLSLALLAPDHAGLTALEQPSLFWFQSRSTAHPIEITIVIPGRAEPVLQLASSRAPKGTVHRIDLKKQGVRLEEGVTYRWSVAIVMDPGHRSKDLVASGVIERISGEARNAGTGRDSPNWDKGVAAARRGLWYDAVACVADLGGEERWEGLAQLARQVDLNEVAAYCEEQRGE